MPIRWRVTQDKPTDVSGRGWREILRAAWLAVGHWWDATVKPRVFAPGAGRTRGWQPRQPEYEQFKQRMAGRRMKDGRYISRSAADRDAVLTGDTRLDVMATQVPRAFPTRVTIDIPTKAYVQMRPNPTGKRAGAPPIGLELARVLPDEIAEAEQVWAEEFQRRLDGWREQHVTTGGS